MPRVDKDTFIQEMLQAAEFNRVKPEPDSKEWWREVAQGLAIKAGEAEQQATAAAQQRDALRDALEAARAEMDCQHGDADPAFNYGHRCVMCDDNVDGNMVLRKRIDAALAATQPPPTEVR